MSELDLGYLIEGVVEQDPLSDRYVVKVDNGDGVATQFSIQDALARYVGQEVRLTLASFDAIDKIAAMVEQGNVTLDQPTKVG